MSALWACESSLEDTRNTESILIKTNVHITPKETSTSFTTIKQLLVYTSVILSRVKFKTILLMLTLTSYLFLDTLFL